MKRLYETKVDNEIELRSKNEALERKKFKLEHPNSFAILENQQDMELNLTSQNVKIEPSSLGWFNEPSPTQIIASKNISNPLMGKVFPKNLLIQLTQQVVEIFKRNFNKEAESESPKSKIPRLKASLRLEDKDD